MARTSLLLIAVIALSGCKDDSSSKAAPTPPVAAAPEAGPPVPTATGTVRGTVTLTGEPPVMKPQVRKSDPVCAATPAAEPFLRVGEGGALADVLVRLPVGAAPAATPPAEHHAIDQTQCNYTPYVSGIIAGQSVAIRNSDATAHNVNAAVGTDSLLNRAQPQGQPAIVRPVTEAPGSVVTFTCDIHNWMRAYAVVSDHGIFTTTAADGSFALEGVPVGEQQIEAWHPHLGLQKLTILVAEDVSEDAVFEFPTAAFTAP